LGTVEVSTEKVNKITFGGKIIDEKLAKIIKYQKWLKEKVKVIMLVSFNFIKLGIYLFSGALYKSL